MKIPEHKDPDENHQPSPSDRVLINLDLSLSATMTELDPSTSETMTDVDLI